MTTETVLIVVVAIAALFMIALLLVLLFSRRRSPAPAQQRQQPLPPPDNRDHNRDYLQMFPSNVRTEVVQNRKTILEQLKTEEARITGKLEMAAEAIAEDVQTIEAFHEKIIKLEQDLERQRTNYGDQERTITQLRETIQDKNSEIIELGERIEESVSHSRRMEEELQIANQAIDDLKLSYRDVAQRNSEYHGARQALESEKNNLLERLNAVNQSLHDRDQLVDQAVRDTAEAKSGLADEQAMRSLAENKLARALQRVNEIQHEYERSVDQMRAERDVAEAKLETATDERDRLNQQLLQNDREINRLQGTVDVLRTENSRLEGEMATQNQALRNENRDLRAHTMVLERIIQQHSIRVPRLETVDLEPDDLDVSRVVHLAASTPAPQPAQPEPAPSPGIPPQEPGEDK